MKAILGLLVALIVAGAFAVASIAANAENSPRSGALHLTKECSAYTGLAGSYCTITSSNLNAIDAGAQAFYASAATATLLDSDIVLYNGPGNSTYGHVTLNRATKTGLVTFSGGTGRFSGFHASAAVTYNAETKRYQWDGTYNFTPPGDDR